MDKLKFINEQMSVLEIPYEFMEWTGEIKYPYFTGEITENEPITEDGAETAVFILNGFTRGKYIDLELIKDKIKTHFPAIGGLRAQTEHGAIAVYYGGSLFVPTGEMDLKRIQINLIIQEWSCD